MTNSRNQIQLIGRLGQDVRVYTTANNHTVARVTLATNEYYRNEQGALAQKTQWHNLISWGKTAQRLASQVSKGQQVLITGKIQYRSFNDKNDVGQVKTEIVIDSFLPFVGNKLMIAADLPEPMSPPQPF